MFGERLRLLRENKNYSMDKLIELYNNKYDAKMNKSTLSRYENGIQEPIYTVVVNLADFFNVSVDYLSGNAKSEPASVGVKIPVLGTVAAGIPIEAIENIIDYEEIPEEMARTGEFFALKIKGDSMAPRILDGDVVIVRKQSDVDSGDIAIVLINGDEATVKCLKKQSDGIILTAYNIDVWEPKYYSKKDIQTLPVAVLGKVVELRGKF